MVTNGNSTESFSTDINVEDAVTLQSAVLADTLTVNIGNNSGKYGLSTDSIYVVAQIEGINGIIKKTIGKTIQVADGSSAVAQFEISKVENGTDTVKVYLFQNKASIMPLCAPYIFHDGSFMQGMRETITGEVAGIELEEPLVDAVNETVTIKGVLSGGGKRYVAVRLMDKDIVCQVAETVSDDEGAFSIKLSYDKDGMNVGTILTISAGAFHVNTPVQKSFVVVNEESISGFLAHIRDENVIRSTDDFEAYLNANPDETKLIGVYLQEIDYSELKSDNRKNILNGILAFIKAGNVIDVPDYFKSETAKMKTIEDTEDAILAINGSTQSTLTGILEKYKTLCGITDTLWKSYNALEEKVVIANDKFLNKGNINSLSVVADRLADAVSKTASNNDIKPDSPKNKFGSTATGSSGNNYVTPVQPEQTQVISVPAKTIFIDIETVEWAKESIESLAEKGIVSGVGGGRFEPESTVTREVFVKMIVSAFDFEAENSVSGFKDVNSSEWYYPYVAVAEKIGLVNGDSGYFNVGLPLTRQDMVTILSRAVDLSKVELPNVREAAKFIDNNDIADYASDAVEDMWSAGIIDGMEDGSFAPRELCTRAMAAKVLFNLLKLKK